MRPALLFAFAFAAPVAAPSRAAAQASALARGAEVAQRFCYACHDREERQGHNPLLPRLDERRFGTPAAASASVGHLDLLSGAMTLPFTGTDEERSVLAAWLADAAQRRARDRAAREGWAVVLAAGVAAAAVFLTLRGRRQRPGA